MKTAILASFVFMFCLPLFAAPAIATENTNEDDGTIYIVTVDIPDVLILPSSFWYPIKRKWENFKGWFIFDPQKKTEYFMELSDKRLNEMYQESVSGNTEYLQQLENDFKKHTNKVLKHSKKIDNQEQLTDLAQDLTGMQVSHQELFSAVTTQAPQSVDNVVADLEQSVLDEFSFLIKEILTTNNN